MLTLLTRIAITLLTLFAVWKVGSQLVATQLPPEESLAWDATQPYTYYRLGLYYRDDFDAYDLEKAAANLEKSVALNPQAWNYWQELARTYEMADRPEEASRAYQRSLELNPLSTEFRWQTANFELRRGAVDAALKQLGQVLETDLGQAAAAYELLESAGVGTERIASIFPAEPTAQRRLFSLALDHGAAAEWLAAQWDALLDAKVEDDLDSDGGVTVAWGQRYLNYLFRGEHYAEARRQWIRLARIHQLVDAEFESGINRIWNADFALDRTQSLFDWHFSQSDSVRFAFDSSLVVEFNGRENLRGSLLNQTLLLDPGRYRLSFEAAAEGVTTEQGPHFELRETRSGKLLASTDMLLGHQPMQAYAVDFQLPQGSGAASLSLTRRASRRIDSQIRGRIIIRHLNVTYQ